MTREQVVTQVLARVKARAEFEKLARQKIVAWLEAFPAKYVFSGAEVMAGERFVRRELGLK